jgi:enamine deaminase RidA (YjgF/YER057c/UK114 family)
VATNGQRQLVGKNDMRAQLRQVFENIKNLLDSQDADFSNLVTVTIFTVSIEEFLKAADIREEYTGGSPPSTTLVQIDQLASPDYLVEIAAGAALE